MILKRVMVTGVLLKDLQKIIYRSVLYLKKGEQSKNKMTEYILSIAESFGMSSKRKGKEQVENMRWKVLNTACLS